MTVGTHTVVFIPDPDVQAWGAVLDSNAYFNTDIVGWRAQVAGPPWRWSAGKAINDAVPNAGANLIRDPAFPIPRPPGATLYRVTGSIYLAAAGWIIVTCRFGRTANAASFGPNSYPNDATDITQWIYANAPGNRTVELVVDPSSVNAAFTYVTPMLGFGPNSYVEVDSLTLQSQGAVVTDITCLVDSVSIHHGRTDTNTQPEASSCTLAISLDTGETQFPALDVGGIIRVTTAIPATSSTRFVGRITDIAQGWDEAGEDTPDRARVDIIATSYLAELGRRVVGDVPWAQELDGARVSRIMAAAGITLDPNTSDPGTVQLLARDVDQQPALDVAQSAAESAGGIVWATRTGDVRYADANHRRGATSALSLDACDVLVTPVWTRSTDGLINDVSIGYGAVPEGSDQPRYVAERTDSKTRYGEYGVSATTELAALADATAMGQLLLVRNRQPAWVLTELPLDVEHLDDTRTAALLGLDMNDLVSVTGLPVAGATPSSAYLWVEGWSEQLSWGVHDLTLTVSDYCRTSPAPRWDSVPSAWTWDTISPASLTWDDATCFGPIASEGRWDDVPASQRWDKLAPSVTWDNYKTT